MRHYLGNALRDMKGYLHWVTKVMPDMTVALIDFGQTKQLGYRFRKELAEIIVLLSECGDSEEDWNAVSLQEHRLPNRSHASCLCWE